MSPNNEGVVVLGAPIGSPDFEERICKQKANEIIEQMELLDTALRSPSGFVHSQIQTIYALVRLCCPQQFNYLLRTCPPSSTLASAKLLDTAIQKFIFSITDSMQYLHPPNTKEMEIVLKRLFGSIRCGGMGM